MAFEVSCFRYCLVCFLAGPGFPTLAMWVLPRHLTEMTGAQGKRSYPPLLVLSPASFGNSSLQSKGFKSAEARKEGADLNCFVPNSSGYARTGDSE